MDTTRLQASKLFSALDAGSQIALAAAAVEREVAAGGWVVQQGDPGGALYIVTRGAAEVSSRSAEDGLEYLQPAAGPGDDYGLAEALSGAAHTASVRASVAMQVAVISASLLADACASRPALASRTTRGRAAPAISRFRSCGKTASVTCR